MEFVPSLLAHSQVDGMIEAVKMMHILSKDMARHHQTLVRHRLVLAIVFDLSADHLDIVQCAPAALLPFLVRMDVNTMHVPMKIVESVLINLFSLCRSTFANMMADYRLLEHVTFV